MYVATLPSFLTPLDRNKHQQYWTDTSGSAELLPAQLKRRKEEVLPSSIILLCKSEGCRACVSLTVRR